MNDIRLLEQNFNADVERDIDKIIAHIKGIKGKLSITAKAENDWDLLEFIENREQALDSYELTEDGVSFLIYSEAIFDLIKRYIDSDNIYELEMPVVSLCDPSFLNRMNNLKTIDIGEFDFLGGDSLKTIVENSCVSNINAACRISPFTELQDNISLSYDMGECFYSKYKDVIIRSKNGYDYDDFSLDINNIQNFEEAWKIFLQECSDKRDFNLSVNCYDEVEKYDKSIMSLSFKDGKISNADIKIDDYSTAVDVLLMIEEYFNDDAKVRFYVKNNTYDEFYKVAKILKKYDSEISYSDDSHSFPCDSITDVDGFEYMRSTIDYYKGLINEYNLSPLEKLIYAYDLIKSYSYNECEEDKSKSREIPDIIREGHIVCVGYSSFLDQLLNELGFNASNVSLSVFDNGDEFGHARSIIYLKDDKYGIDGVYSLDATYDSRGDNLSLVLDSNGENVKKHPNENDTILKKYDPTASFYNFLVPYSEYSLYYTTEIENVYESLSDFIYYIDNANSLSEYDKESFDEYIRKLFGNDYDINECINKVKNSSVIPDDKLRSALEVVKRCQNYTEEEVKHFIDEVMEIREIKSERVRNINKKNNVNDDEKSY